MSVLQAFNEGGTAIITVTFEDESDNPVVPNSANWSLYSQGQVVNGRDEVPVNSFYTENEKSKADIVLQGDDLIGGGAYLIVKGDYDSDAGTNLPFRFWTEIPVNRMPFSQSI